MLIYLSLARLLPLIYALPRPVPGVLHTTSRTILDRKVGSTLSRSFYSPTGILGPALTAAAASLTPPGVVAPGECKAYAILSARGTSENQVDPAGSRNLISTLLATVPNGESYEVVYPASINILTDPETGALDVMKHLDAMLSKCPSQKLVFFGYSQGAMVMINAMNAPSVRARVGNVRAAVFYGNPYFRYGLAQDRGTATSGSGVGLLKNVVEGSNSVPNEYVPVVRDFCNEGDPVCQGLLHLKLSDLGAALSNSGPAFAEHHYEGKLQELEAIQFAIQQLQA